MNEDGKTPKIKVEYADPPATTASSHNPNNVLPPTMQLYQTVPSELLQTQYTTQPNLFNIPNNLQFYIIEVKPEHGPPQQQLISINPNKNVPTSSQHIDMNSLIASQSGNPIRLAEPAAPTTTTSAPVTDGGSSTSTTATSGTKKKEESNGAWTEETLKNALDAVRSGQISANKASKAYGVPPAVLYKAAKQEGIRLAAPFNAAPTTWTPEALRKALDAIRNGQASVQKASDEFGIPLGTLYGRCKREGIELSRSKKKHRKTPWAKETMNKAVDAVRTGTMTVNQASNIFNLPYGSIYGRIKRLKNEGSLGTEGHNMVAANPINMQHHVVQLQQKQTQSSHIMQPQHSSSQQIYFIQPKVDRG